MSTKLKVEDLLPGQKMHLDHLIADDGGREHG
jgi:hypothetical protein